MSPWAPDEDDVRIRPSKGTRARTRRRPAYADATGALVVTVDRGRYSCRTDAGVAVSAIRGGDVRRDPVVVGDRVQLTGDVSGTAGSLARIVRLDPRTSVLRRSADDTDPTERPVVANADLLVVVVALADPPPQPRLLDRCLVAAFDGGLTPLLCFTKPDLDGAGAARAELTERYRDAGAALLTVEPHGAPGPGLAELAAALAGRTSVLFGSSGVGKSTLVNRLVPDALRSTGTVSGVGKGRHTSSSAIALQLPGGGWAIDTPGVRSFGLALVHTARVVAAWPELAEQAEHCPPRCDHLGAECTLDQAVRDGRARAGRLASLRRLLTALRT